MAILLIFPFRMAQSFLAHRVYVFLLIELLLILDTYYLVCKLKTALIIIQFHHIVYWDFF